VVRVSGYGTRGPASIPAATRFSNGVPLSLVSTIEELLDIKVAASV
jgi:hypothetical protein